MNKVVFNKSTYFMLTSQQIVVTKSLTDKEDIENPSHNLTLSYVQLVADSKLNCRHVSIIIAARSAVDIM